MAVHGPVLVLLHSVAIYFHSVLTAPSRPRSRATVVLETSVHTLLLDVDTGTDDALALLYAAAHPNLQLAGVSCVAGNASLRQVLINTHKVLDAAGARELPVAAGASRPLLEKARHASQVHGSDGLGDIALPETHRACSSLGATDLLYEQILRAADPVTLVALAPQTNVALLLSQHPDVVHQLERIVFMGGSASVGNATPVAEFNIWHDPEAAAIVLNSGVALQMYGLDVFTRLVIAEQTARQLADTSHPATRLAGQLLLRRVQRTDANHGTYSGLIGDAGALVMLANPSLFTLRRLPMQVNLTGIGRGQTIVDQRTAVGEDHLHGVQESWPLVDVALDLDVEAAAADFVRVIQTYLD